MLQLPIHAFPTLKTERLRLIQMSINDSSELHAIRSDEQIMEYIGRPRTACPKDAEVMIESLEENRLAGKGITWAIKESVGEKLLGIVGFYRLNNTNLRGELGYTLHSSQWGKGIMSEAIQATIKCGFERFAFNAVEAHTDPNNLRSMKILERNGFRLAGTFKENFKYNGKFFDSAIWELLGADWRKRKA